MVPRTCKVQHFLEIVCPLAHFGFPDSCCCVSPHSSSSSHRGQSLLLQHSGQEDRVESCSLCHSGSRRGRKRHQPVSIAQQQEAHPLNPAEASPSMGRRAGGLPRESRRGRLGRQAGLMNGPGGMSPGCPKATRVLRRNWCESEKEKRPRPGEDKADGLIRRERDARCHCGCVTPRQQRPKAVLG